MRIYNRAVPRSGRNRLRLNALGKLTAAGLATLAGFLLFFAAHVRRPIQPDALVASSLVSASDSKDNPLPALGLSHTRQDFDKALGLLAAAAAKDPRLAEYNDVVQARVTGKGAATDSASPGPITDPAPGVNPGANAEKQSLHGAAQEPVGEKPAVLGNAASSRANTAVARWISYYTTSERGRRTMAVGLERSSAYLPLAREEFRKVGAPEDLVWLAQVESVWNPVAVSPAAAGGIWQFIPKTAADYGLTVEAGNDERADPLKQTRAAAIYLHDLYTIFGDWDLAMAAYNSGEPRVMEAIIKNRQANFWELYEKRLLPKETCDYVPKILAAMEVAGHPDLYNFPEPAAYDPETAAANLQ